MGFMDSLFGGGKSTYTPGGAAFVPFESYKGAESGIEQGWGYLSGGLQALQEGKPPTWFQNWRPLEESQRKAALYGTYYGGGAGAQGGNVFGPGVLGTQRAADVRAGRRGAGAGSNFAKQLDMYSQGMSDIDDYLSKLGYESMNTAEERYLSTMSQFPRQKYGQVVPFSGQQSYQASPWESMSKQLLPGIASLIGMGTGMPWLGSAVGAGMGAADYFGGGSAGDFLREPMGQDYSGVYNAGNVVNQFSGGGGNFLQGMYDTLGNW